MLFNREEYKEEIDKLKKDVKFLENELAKTNERLRRDYLRRDYLRDHMKTVLERTSVKGDIEIHLAFNALLDHLGVELEMVERHLEVKSAK